MIILQKNFLLNSEDFVSGRSFVSLYNHFEQSLYNAYNSLRENIYLPLMRFLFTKSLFENVFDQMFSICQPIF